ncbi:hypothetical protein [Pseudogulbenkiania sp. MAI-1]|uniref:hypothetical protein n=1 Tax=Pseudogulbenkiania sp. MAI-1 TaxID=990370 RepID=UPI00045EBC98|nr:hypothetical protein [Pseudogulbenkiania sp. MAI-1]
MSDLSEKARLEVLAAIGLHALRDMQGQPERIQALFNSLMPLFRDRIPHHKLLSHLCQEARAPRDITPGKMAVVDCNGGWFAATLADDRVIERADVEQLGEELLHLGYTPDSVRIVDQADDPERSLSAEQRMALIAAMSKGDV